MGKSNKTGRQTTDILDKREFNIGDTSAVVPLHSYGTDRHRNQNPHHNDSRDRA